MKRTYVVSAILILLVALFVFWDSGVNYNVYVLLGNFIIILIALRAIFIKNNLPYSLNIVFYLFCLFFFGISPIIQFKSNINFMGSENSVTNSSYIILNSIIILSMLLHGSIYKYITKKRSLIRDQLTSNSSHNVKFLIVLFSIITLIIQLIYLEFDFKCLISRKAMLVKSTNLTSPILAIVDFIRVLPLLLLIFFKLTHKKNIKIELLLIAIIIVTNFPTAIPRFKAAVIYLPLLLIYTKVFNIRHFFAGSFIFVFLTIFPYMHHFRYNNNLIPNKIFNFEMFSEKHFDSYQNTALLISNEIVTNGEQLFCTIFFFVPRSIWPNKCEGTGHLLAKEINYEGFTNVAVSFLGEGFVNFGFFGAILFACLVSLMCCLLDFHFWFKNKKSIGFKVGYLVSIPLLFYLLRGDLLSSYANIFSTIILILSLSFFFKRKQGKIKKTY